MKLYDDARYAIRISFFAFALIAFGYLIQNENVNIFYTFSNPVLLAIAEGALRLGRTIVMNLPLIFMVNFVCKKANSGFPIILSLLAYFTYMITMALYANQSYLTTNPYIYNTTFGGLFNVAGLSYPFETGLIGSFIVAFVTKIAYVISRQNKKRIVLSILNNDTAAIIYVLLGSVLAGLLMAYLFPIGFNLLQKAITYISLSLADSKRLFFYGILDRALSIFGLGDLIRYPFWYTSLGGTYSSILTGEVVVGDVSIWNAIKDVSTAYVGAGRYITPYYVINIFIIPAIYLGMYFSMSDKKEKAMHLLGLIALILLSIACGNPLPLELALLFTAPGLLIIYLLVVGGLFWYLSSAGIFLGFSNQLGDITTAMPGSFPDYVINIRNIKYADTVSSIFIIGIVIAVVMFLLTLLYYNFLAYDIAGVGKADTTSEEIIDAVGGEENIVNATNGLLRLNIQLYDLEVASSTKIQKLKARKIVQTKDGISMDLGTSSKIIARNIRKKLNKKN